MAISLAGKATRRAELTDAAIRDALADGNGRDALYRALRALQSEMRKLRDRRPGDGALADAELAGSISVIAARLHNHKPSKPAGCPRVPGPDHLLAAFEASRAQAEEGSAR